MSSTMIENMARCRSDEDERGNVVAWKEENFVFCQIAYCGFSNDDQMMTCPPLQGGVKPLVNTNKVFFVQLALLKQGPQLLFSSLLRRL